MNISTLIFHLLLVASLSITTLGLNCYECSDDKLDNCGDKFNPNGNGVQEVNSKSGYCWKMKAEAGKLKGVLRGGDRIENQNSIIYCPTMNTCKTYEAAGMKATICCCQDKDFCNMASTNAFTFCALLLNAIFIYIFTHMY